jgi:Transposase DDE domain group 1
LTTLIGQRVFGLALGNEDLIDHDELRHDLVPAVLAGKLAARRRDCAPLAGSRYHRIGFDEAQIAALFVDLFPDAHERAPKKIILDLDATDDPLHGHQVGRFFHGYYDCYCYLPLYVFCGRHLLAAKLRRSNIDASTGAVEEVARIVRQIRRRWPRVRILLARRWGVRPRQPNDLVRGEPGRLSVWAGPQPGRGDRGRACRGRSREPRQRQTGAPVPRFHPVDLGPLPPVAPR